MRTWPKSSPMGLPTWQFMLIFYLRITSILRTMGREGNFAEERQVLFEMLAVDHSQCICSVNCFNWRNLERPCWILDLSRLPFALFVLAHQPKVIPKWLYVVAIIMAHGNSAVNPILYGLTNKKFRDGYRKVLGMKSSIVPNPRLPPEFSRKPRYPVNTTIQPSQGKSRS